MFGRDQQISCALILLEYCEVTDVCRRDFLFRDFCCYIHNLEMVKQQLRGCVKQMYLIVL